MEFLFVGLLARKKKKGQERELSASWIDFLNFMPASGGATLELVRREAPSLLVPWQCSRDCGRSLYLDFSSDFGECSRSGALLIVCSEASTSDFKVVGLLEERGRVKFS